MRVFFFAMIGAVLTAPAQESAPPAAAAQASGTQSPESNPADQKPAEKQSTCVTCHQNQGGRLSAPTGPFPTDIHAEKGLTCASCHGGDPTSMDPKVAMGPAKGFRGKPSREQVPEFCGRCHSNTTYMHRYNPSVQTDQMSLYYTSQHGKLLRQGDRRVATCINCHSVHDIKLASDPSSPVYPLNIPDTCGKCHSDPEYMAGYDDLPGLTQVTDYQKSVHYASLREQGNLSAPTCITCHSSHGAIPPGARSIADVCGTCHANNRQYFEASPHAAAFAEMDIRGCVQCHGNHEVKRSDERMLVGPDSVCLTCHQEEDAGATRAQEMADKIHQLDAAINLARATLEEADQAGMDVSASTAELANAHSHLVISRTAIHSLDSVQVGDEIDQGLPIAAKVLQEGKDKLAEIQSRRKGVALFSLLVLAIVLSLYLYIREEDKSQQPSQ
ncbi:MAG: cytochrome c3 family protein [Acidobacteria bacterium]|nr:cytochrome c3 family protein [Acidobacteriota bacterium]